MHIDFNRLGANNDSMNALLCKDETRPQLQRGVFEEDIGDGYNGEIYNWNHQL